MNFIKDFFHVIGAWKIWNSFFHDYVATDWVLFAACLIFFIYGALKGFGFFLGKIIRILILIFTVMLVYPPLVDWASAHLTFAKAGFWKPFFFFILAAFVIWLMRKLSKFGSQKALPQFHPFLDGVTGALSGFFLVLLVVSFALQFILFFPGKKMHHIFENGGSRHGAVVRDFVPQLVDNALAPVRSLVNRKVTHS